MSTTGILHSRLGKCQIINEGMTFVLSKAYLKLWLLSMYVTRVNHVFIATDAVPFSNAHFGAGIGTIYLDNVGCTGSEANLIDCLRSSTVSCAYSHAEDAGVRCQGLEELCD